MKYVILDTETGGLESETHSLLSFAFIKATSRFQELESLHLKILHPVFHVSSQAMSKNKLDLRDTADWVPPDVAKQKLYDFLGVKPSDTKKQYAEYMAIGANITFDIGFMKHFCGEVEWNSIFYHRSEDVLSSYRDLQKTGVVPTPKGYALSQLLSAIGIETDPDALHDALYDAKQTLALAREMQKRVDLLGDALKSFVARHGGDLEAVLSCYREIGTKSKLKSLRRK